MIQWNLQSWQSLVSNNNFNQYLIFKQILNFRKTIYYSPTSLSPSNTVGECTLGSTTKQAIITVLSYTMYESQPKMVKTLSSAFKLALFALKYDICKLCCFIYYRKTVDIFTTGGPFFVSFSMILIALYPLPHSCNTFRDHLVKQNVSNCTKICIMENLYLYTSN